MLSSRSAIRRFKEELLSESMGVGLQRKVLPH